MAALFIIEKKRQSKCPSTNKWINITQMSIQWIWLQGLSFHTCCSTGEPWKHEPEVKEASNKSPHIVKFHLYEMFGTGKYKKTRRLILGGRAEATWLLMGASFWEVNLAKSSSRIKN